MASASRELTQTKNAERFSPRAAAAHHTRVCRNTHRPPFTLGSHHKQQATGPPRGGRHTSRKWPRARRPRASPSFARPGPRCERVFVCVASQRGRMHSAGGEGQPFFQRPLPPLPLLSSTLQGVTTDDMVAALGLSHAELVTAINELLASVSCGRRRRRERERTRFFVFPAPPHPPTTTTAQPGRPPPRGRTGAI